MLNEVPSGCFGCSRELRQGDPLSPLIFLLVAEVLGGMVDRAVEVGMLEAFQVGLGNMAVSHLQFADDTLFLCANSQRQIRYLHCILRCFEAMTGLKVNFGKSALIAVSDVPNIDMLAADLGCRVGSFPATYPGLPLGASFKRFDVWNPMVDRIKRRLSGWEVDPH